MSVSDPSILRLYPAHAWSFIDNWPKQWLCISPATRLLRLSSDEIAALTSDADDTDLRVIVLHSRLAEMMGPDEWFIRLNSRSPKDSSGERAPITSSAAEALRWIRNSRDRALQDLIAMQAVALPAFICIREVIRNVEAHEYRCIVEAGVLRGVAFTSTRSVLRSEENGSLIKAIADFLRAKIAPYAPCRDFVVDLHAPALDALTMIEINPLEGADTFGVGE